MDKEYTEEELEGFGRLICQRLAEKFGKDPMKMYLLSEVLEGWSRGDDVSDDLVKLFKDTIVEAIIDGTLELEEE